MMRPRNQGSVDLAIEVFLSGHPNRDSAGAEDQ